jgi:cytochrome P450 family 135
MPGTRCLGNLVKVVLTQDATDPHELTRRRFERTTLQRGASLPPVDPRSLPPGPRWPSLVQTVALLRYRHRFQPWLWRTYGDVYTVRLPKGRPLVLFTRPEHAKEIFAGDPAVFHAGKGNAILGPVMGEHSLLLQDGADHQRARKLLMPAFNGQALRSYADLVSAIARDEVAHWPDGATFRSHERMNVVTLEVILRVVFGVTDERRLAALRPRVNATVNISPAVLMVWELPSLSRIGPWKRALQNQVELDELMYAEIRERRTADDLDERTDVLSRLIREGRDTGDELSDVELRDQLVTLLLAGHETTATALAWALYELGRSPSLQQRTVQAAADGGDEWLDAVLKESMRLHPVIPLVNRTLLEPRTIGGWDLPRGTTVAPSILIAHARADNHERPERFDPTRFLGHNPPTNTWIPFGGGVRRCIGAGFSLMEGVAVLREVFGAVGVETVGDDEPRVRNITSVPRYGARIRVTRR